MKHSKVDDNEKIICVNSENWHPGVIGIVASKLLKNLISHQL